MSEFLYRVTARKKDTDEWVPVAGGRRSQKTRAYPKLGTARGVKSQWTNDPYSKRYYDAFRIERLPQTWEVVE